MNIVLLREEEENDSYHNLFLANGFSVCSIPVLSFTYYNIDKLEVFFRNLNGYSALIITSKRAVYALEIMLKNAHISVQTLPKDFFIYVVGKSTEICLQKLGLNSLGCDTGNATELAEFILKRKDYHFKPLLFACGDLARETIPVRLKSLGLTVETISCYKTVADTNFPEKFSLFIRQYNVPNVIVFFSPSGVKFYFSDIKKLCADFENTKIIAIGQYTADNILNIHTKVDAIVKKPTPDSLLETIQTLQTGLNLL